MNHIQKEHTISNTVFVFTSNARSQTSKKKDPRKPLSRLTAQATDQKCMLMFVSGIMDLDCLN